MQQRCTDVCVNLIPRHAASCDSGWGHVGTGRDDAILTDVYALLHRYSKLDRQLVSKQMAFEDISQRHVGLCIMLPGKIPFRHSCQFPSVQLASKQYILIQQAILFTMLYLSFHHSISPESIISAQPFWTDAIKMTLCIVSDFWTKRKHYSCWCAKQWYHRDG